MGKADLKRWTRQNSTFKVFFTVILEKPETWYGVKVD